MSGRVFEEILRLCIFGCLELHNHAGEPLCQRISMASLRRRSLSPNAPTRRGDGSSGIRRDIRLRLLQPEPA